MADETQTTHPSQQDQQQGQQQDTQQGQQTQQAQQNGQQDNETAKWRRLHERADGDLKTARGELDTERTARTQAEERAAAALRRAIAAEHGLSGDALEFLTANDEDGLTAQAKKLSGMVGQPGAAEGQPGKAGTTTNPAGNQQPSLEEQIAAAEKAGQRGLAISLKRQQAFGAG